MKKLLELRAKKREEMQGLLNIAKEEQRALTQEEQDKFNTLEKEIRSIDTTIELEKRAGILGDPQPVAPKTEDEEVRAFVEYIRGVVSGEKRATNLTVSDNGAVIPKTIANKIIEHVKDVCPIYAMSDRYNVKGTLSLPVYDETTQKITAAYANEFTALTSNVGKFESVDLTGYLAGAFAEVSKSLLNNSDFDLVNFVVRKMGDAIAEFIEGELLKGTNSKIDGCKGVTQVVTAASANAITADELIDLQEKVHDRYQANAVWIMNKATRTAIRKLKDGDGTYLLQKDATSRWGYTLFGKDVYCSDAMDTMASGKEIILYGDLTGLSVNVPEEVSVDVSREPFLPRHSVGIIGWVQLDAKVTDKQKLAKLKMGV